MEDKSVSSNLENDVVNDKIDNELINLTLVNGTGFIFDADDYMKLRRQHRILGMRVGTCTFSAADKIMPVELTTWETRLLVEQKVAHVVSKTRTFLQPMSNEQLGEHAQRTASLAAEQMIAFKSKKLENTRKLIPQILEGKRRKLNQDEKIPLAAGMINEQEVLDDAAKNFVFNDKLLLSQTLCAYPELHRGQKCLLGEEFSLIYYVFRDCWLRGFYIMSGETFGADLLLYPGDPLIYHASHIVILVQSTKEVTLDALELIAKARMSVFVNKICLFAYVTQTLDNSTEGIKNVPEILYQTVEWRRDLNEFSFDDDS